MKQNMTFEAHQTNLLKMWEVETERLNHIRRLNTIYHDKGRSLREQEDSHQHYMLLHLRNKEKDSQRKHRSFQHRIDQENHILRNKLLDATLPTHLKPRPHVRSVNSDPADTIEDSRRDNSFSANYLQKQEKAKIGEENAKIFMKLATMKSDFMGKLKIREHVKKTEELKDKLEKKSPKKMKQLRNFFRRRNLQFGELIIPTHIHGSVENEEEYDL